MLVTFALFAFVSAPSAPLTVYLVGDSTMADKPDPRHNPERGWGQALPAFFDSGVVVKNHAVNGRSTKSFIAESKWDSVRRVLRPGDYVFIQFGHNDEKIEDTTRYAAPNGAYRNNLLRFIRETRAARAVPVLFTPIVRRQWSATGELTNTHGEYPDAVRAVAKQQGVLLIDLEQLTAELLKVYGVEKSKALFVFTTEGQFPAFPTARSDNTHLSPAGAALVAQIAAKRVRALGGALASHVVLGK
ncbi:MAG: rhamnogalacturonan acetylesterase [Gemmatimonas sp.]